MRHLTLLFVFLSLAVASAQDTAESMAEMWGDAFVNRNVEKFGGLLLAGYEHTSACGIVDREEEIRAMTTAFGSSDFLVETANATVMGADDSSANVMFEYTVRFGSQDDSPRLSGRDVLIFVSEDSENWEVRSWLEAYHEGPPTTETCSTHFLGLRTEWLRGGVTAVSELTLGELKARDSHGE